MNKLLKISFLFILLSGICTSCKPDLGGPPTIEFLTGSKYISENDSIKETDTVQVGLKCTWNGKDPLKEISITNNSALENLINIDPMDSEGVAYVLKHGKTSAEKDSIVFELIDEASQMSSISLILYKDTTTSSR